MIVARVNRIYRLIVAPGCPVNEEVAQLALRLRNMSHRDSDISQKLRAALRSAGMSQAELARLIHVDAGQVSRWVNGKAMPTAANLRSLAMALSVDLHDSADAEGIDLYVTYKASPAEPGTNAYECQLLLNGLSHNYTVFSPATIVPHVHSEAPDIAATRNLRALLRSRAVLYCQFSADDRSASGLVEVGLALGLHKNAILLLSDLEWAPFLLQGLSTARNAPADVSDVRIYRCKSADEALGLFENSGLDLLSR